MSLDSGLFSCYAFPRGEIENNVQCLETLLWVPRGTRCILEAAQALAYNDVLSSIVVHLH